MLITYRRSVSRILLLFEHLTVDVVVVLLMMMMMLPMDLLMVKNLAAAAVLEEYLRIHRYQLMMVHLFWMCYLKTKILININLMNIFSLINSDIKVSHSLDFVTKNISAGTNLAIL